jgi:hypothetical protein
MKRANALVTIIVNCLLIFCVGATGQSVSLPKSGTLVIIVPTKDGFVIAADRRTNDSVRGDLDITLKIGRVGQFTAITVTGDSTWLDRATMKVRYDAVEIAEDILSADDLTGALSQYWTPLAMSLTGKFKQYLSSYPLSQWPPAMDTLPDNALFQMQVIHYDLRARQMTVSNLVVLYRPQFGNPWVQASIGDYVPEQLRDSEPMAFGNIKAYVELRDGHDRRFAKWRKERSIRKLLGKHIPANRVSKRDALMFCQQMIRASAEVLPLIDTSPNHVGTTMDVALLSSGTGFGWLYRSNPIP